MVQPDDDTTRRNTNKVPVSGRPPGGTGCMGGRQPGLMCTEPHMRPGTNLILHLYRGLAGMGDMQFPWRPRLVIQPAWATTWIYIYIYMFLIYIYIYGETEIYMRTHDNPSFIQYESITNPLRIHYESTCESNMNQS